MQLKPTYGNEFRKLNDLIQGEKFECLGDLMWYQHNERNLLKSSLEIDISRLYAFVPGGISIPTLEKALEWFESF